jgi:beta-lactamase superfamily II metal-dependent hydrolase
MKRKIVCKILSILLIIGIFVSSIQKISAQASIPLSPLSNELLVIRFLNVGQGDASLITFPNGKVMLIDGGDIEHGKVVVNKLKKYHVQKIDTIVSTHPDIDHIGGLITVLKQYKVGKVVESGKKYGGHAYYLFKKIIQSKHIPIIIAKKNNKINIDNRVSLTILNSAHKNESNNDSSIVIKLLYHQLSVLFTGDIEKKAESRLIKNPDLSSKVLKVAHHGSFTSTTSKFLKQVNPMVAIISYNKRNPYGHPHKSVMRRLQNSGIRIYSTAKNDDVEIVSTGNHHFIEDEEVKFAQ